MNPMNPDSTKTDVLARATDFLTRAQATAIVHGEMDYAETKWNESTTTSGGVHSPAEWLLYIQSYAQEAAAIAAHEADPASRDKVMTILRKIGGMAITAIQQNGCEPRSNPMFVSSPFSSRSRKRRS